MDKLQQEIIDAVKNDTLYDFIANNYWKLGSESMKQLILEIVYAVETHCDTIDKHNIKTQVVEELTLQWEE